MNNEQNEHHTCANLKNKSIFAILTQIQLI